MATILPSPSPDSYKYQWSRYVARRNLENTIEILKQKVEQVPSIPPFETIAELASLVDDVTIGKPPPTPGKFNVGIIGAGCAGLFTGMILDFLNARVENLNIDYEILEAAGEDRLGGRLYTHYFSDDRVKAPHDYYDVGAMRFPDNEIMHRTFQLFDLLGIKKGGKLIRYYMYDEDNVCPSYYNDIGHRGKAKGDDPYQVNKTLPENDKIPKELLTEQAGGAGGVVSKVIKPFTQAFKKVLDEKRASDQTKDDKDANAGWDLLMSADQMSARQFFRSTDIPGINVKGPGFNFNTVEWLETFAYATGWYNQSLSETVLEELDFDAAPEDWYCVEGGTQQIATRMAEKLTHKPNYKHRVTAIEAQSNGQMKLTIEDSLSGEKKSFEKNYFAVVSSTTLPALQRMDLRKAGLRYGTKQAIRTLSYGASCKVGIKFKTGWWMKAPHNIKKGGLAKTDLPLRVCVYPSYNLQDADRECVLLCSYTWAQDAQRLGSLISRDTPQKEERLLETLFHDLALLHATETDSYETVLKKVKDQYITHHSWDWYRDENMNGAFAYFGPGEYSSMWPEIIKPNGWLFLVGEVASAHHAWIVGALESAVRGVYQMLETLHLQNSSGPYKEAMKHLESPDQKDAHLPFGGLPKEMPRRQEGTGKETKTVDLPKDATTTTADLTFTAAQVVSSFFELVVEQSESEVAVGQK